MLIYFDAAAQKKVITTFHYALNNTGYLVLGKSETIGASTGLFTPINKKYKIYARKKTGENSRIPELPLPFVQSDVPEKHNFKTSGIRGSATPAHHQVGNAVDAILLANYMPPSVVINHHLEILEFRGSTELFLKHSSGRASFNIIRMARPEFTFELRNAIHVAIRTKKTVRRESIELKIDSVLRSFSIEVTPMKIDGEEPLLLVLFREQKCVELYPDEKKGSKTKASTAAVAAKDRRIKKLEEELAAYRDEMRSITHDQEAANEELQSANEEVVSSNEELRTVNEELETSKEEIEATNEELNSINQELQKRNEQIEELYKYSEAILATISNPILVLDRNAIIKSANKQFYKAFHLGEDETIGTSLYRLRNKDWNIPELRRLLENIIPRKTFFSGFEVRHTFHALGERVLLLNARRVTQKTSNEELILLVIEDITERAKLQVKEKKLMLELKKGNELLEMANKELTTFNYISSHDLQEPLRKIRTFTKLLLKDEHKNLSEQGRDYFNRIEETASRMQELISDLLDYSAASKSKKRFEKTDLDLIIGEVKKDFEHLLHEKKAKLVNKGLCKINAIRIQMGQLFHNLVSNSLKFARPGVPPRITIKTEIKNGKRFNKQKLAPQKEYCHISFSDNGIGFSNEHREQIFDVFSRLHDREQYSGTGIGLAIVKRIVENHDGVITASGKPNKGVQFDIYLPIR
jgi:two-component system, chemotaxis family, CheB/CheR fusion protein